MNDNYPTFEMQRDGSTHVVGCPKRFYDALTIVGAIYQSKGDYWYLPRNYDNSRLQSLMYARVRGPNIILYADAAEESEKYLSKERENFIREWLDKVPVRKQVEQ